MCNPEACGSWRSGSISLTNSIQDGHELLSLSPALVQGDRRSVRPLGRLPVRKTSWSSCHRAVVGLGVHCLSFAIVPSGTRYPSSSLLLACEYTPSRALTRKFSSIFQGTQAKQKATTTTGILALLLLVILHHSYCSHQHIV